MWKLYKAHTNKKDKRLGLLFKITSCSLRNQDHLNNSFQSEMSETKNWSSGPNEVWDVLVQEVCLNIGASANKD